MSLDLASKLDKRIRIESKVVVRDPQYGTEQVTWTEFACVWAEVKDILPSRAERLADSIQIGRRPTRIPGTSFRPRGGTRNDTGLRGVGVVAQELAAVVPEAVLAHDDGLLSVAYGNLVGVLIEAVKDLAGKVERLEGRT